MGATDLFAHAGTALIAATVVGYLLGSVPFGLMFTRLAGAGDVRKIGSGNIGATNVLRTGKKWAAAATFVCDALKGAAAVLLVRAGWGHLAELVAGFAAIVGHMFPVWLGFKGGKGVSTFFGVMFALFWPAGLLAGATWIAMAFALRISSLSALTATALTPAYMLAFGRRDEAAFAAAVAILIWVMHRANIARLLRGTEPRIGRRET
ncbi:MAG: glycerol-3-phosphate 1-O-acyltransferase PlsY [Alphaproteobacteria bacterium]|nr:glycerol-3-phosphate 1-O-acyltransferase PlsY [Alphaproteobacteria bacterium]